MTGDWMMCWLSMMMVRMGDFMVIWVILLFYLENKYQLFKFHSLCTIYWQTIARIALMSTILFKVTAHFLSPTYYMSCLSTVWPFCITKTLPSSSYHYYLSLYSLLLSHLNSHSKTRKMSQTYNSYYYYYYSYHLLDPGTTSPMIIVTLAVLVVAYCYVIGGCLMGRGCWMGACTWTIIIRNL